MLTHRGVPYKVIFNNTIIFSKLLINDIVHKTNTIDQSHHHHQPTTSRTMFNFKRNFKLKKNKHFELSFILFFDLCFER